MEQRLLLATAGLALRGELSLEISSIRQDLIIVWLLSISADNLKQLGLEIGRFKTGTPPRVKASSVEYDETEIQPGDKAQIIFLIHRVMKIM